MPEKPSKQRAAILGGLIIGIITGTPILYIMNYCCCCGGIMLGGLASIYLYRKEFTDTHIPLESSDALILGIFSGIAGAFIGALLGVIFFYVIGPVSEKALLKLIDWLKVQNELPADQMNRLDEVSQNLVKKMEGGLQIKDVLANLIRDLILCPIFSMLGGLIGFGLFGKKKPVEPRSPAAQ
jgi:hypothetical protein